MCCATSSLLYLNLSGAVVDAASWRAQAALPRLHQLETATMVLPARSCPPLPAALKELWVGGISPVQLQRLVGAMAPLTGVSMTVRVSPDDDLAHLTSGGGGDDDDEAGGEDEEASDGAAATAVPNPYVALRRLAPHVARLDLRLCQFEPDHLRTLLDTKVLPALGPVMWCLQLVLMDWRVAEADVERLRHQLAACHQLLQVRACQSCQSISP